MEWNRQVYRLVRPYPLLYSHIVYTGIMTRPTQCTATSSLPSPSHPPPTSYSLPTRARFMGSNAKKSFLANRDATAAA